MIPTRLTRWEGATAEELAAEWEVPRVHLFARVGSTNDVARGLAEAGAPAGTVVLAEEQVAGRGREGRRWLSPAGLGCWISLLVAGRSPAESGLLPLVIGVAAAAALDPFADPAVVQLKWPNDLLLGERKLGGILCEGVWEAAAPGFVIAGIGLNVLHREQDFPADLRPGATSLRRETGREVERRQVARALVRGARAAVAQPVRALEGRLAAELQRRDALRGREVLVSLHPGQAPLPGVAMGIAPDGALLVRTPEGVLRPMRSGKVRLQGPRDPTALTSTSRVRRSPPPLPLAEEGDGG